jgi:hypothetical protein
MVPNRDCSGDCAAGLALNGKEYVDVESRKAADDRPILASTIGPRSRALPGFRVAEVAAEQRA